MLLVEAEMVTFLQGYDSRHEQFKDWTVWRGHGRVGPESATGWAAGTVRKVEKNLRTSGCVLFNGPWFIHTTGCASKLSCQPSESQNQV